MTTTALRTRRRLGVVLASALTVAGLVALAPTASAAQTELPVADSGIAAWGISDYLNAGSPGRPGPAASAYTAPATYSPTTKLSSFAGGNATGSVAADGSAVLAFKGASVNWAAGTGNGWLRLADPIVTVDATGTGTVSAEVSFGTTPDGVTWTATPTTRGPQRIVVENLSPDSELGDAVYPTALSSLTYGFAATPTTYTWSHLIGRWSSELIAFLATNDGTTGSGWTFKSTVVNNVVNGVSRYPSALNLSLDRTVAATSATPSVDGDGITIAVAGTGFKKTSPGVYVSLRERTPGDAPYAGGSLPAGAPTAWVSNNASDVGPDPATQANASIAEDGSFSVDLGLDAAATATLDPAMSYSIVTRKGHGQGTIPTNANQVTEIPVDIAALKQTTAVAAPDVSASVGTDAVVHATVTPATGGTPAGTVTVLDGETVKGTGTVSAGAAAITLTGLPAGTKSYTLRYSGAGGYWKSAGTVVVSVAKRASVITVTGAAKVAYRTASTYTAAVSAGATGNVVLTGVGAAITKPIVNGKATFTLPTNLTAGAKTLRFAYAGSAENAAAPSRTTSVTISKGAAKVGVTVVRKATAVKAGRVTVTLRSTKGGPVPTGKVAVSFTKGSVTRTLTAKVLAGGKVTFDLPKVPKGTWVLKLGYLGSTQHSAVTRSVNLTVAAR